MRILPIIASLAPGGAERVITTLSNTWAGRGTEVVLLTLDDGATPPFYPLHPQVDHRPLALDETGDGRLRGGLRRIAGLRRAIRPLLPATVVSFIDQTNVLTLLATAGLSCRVVISERVDPLLHPIGPFWETLRNACYPTASTLVVQTGAARSYFSPRIQAKTRVIPNPVPAPTGGNGGHPGREKRILGMGRLTRQKGFDLLIDAFARIAPRHPDWSLEIYGDGAERTDLERRAARRDLAGRIRLPGTTTTPGAVMRDAGLFVLSSRFEGFPNVLSEAMARGLPVIATDCPSGPRELVRDGSNGLLVPTDSIEGLAAALDRLLADPGARERLGARATDIGRRFAVERIVPLWDACLTGQSP